MPSRDSIILSPEYVNCGRREARALQAVSVGTLLTYSNATIQGVTVTPAGTKPPLNLVAVENVADAGDVDYIYQTEANVHFQSVPKGCIVNLKALPGTYNPADEVEIDATGSIKPLDAGVAVGVVAIFGGRVVDAPEGYDMVAIELY